MVSYKGGRMYSIKIEDKPKCCKDCLFCHEVRPVIFMLTRYFCAIKTMAIEDKYKLAPWCPISNKKPTPATLSFAYDKKEKEYVAKGTGCSYTIELNREDDTLFLYVENWRIGRRTSKSKIKPNTKEFKKLFSELVEEAQRYENSCYAPVRAKRKDAE